MQNRPAALPPALRALMTAVALGSAGVGAAQEPSPPADGAGIVSALLEQYARLGDFRLPALTSAETAALVAGESFITVFDDSGSERREDARALRVVGMQVVVAPRVLVWLSVLGEGDALSSHVSRTVLARAPAGGYVTYQHMDLPWPFKDRQWVILSEKNVALAEDSEGRIWEHRWSLLPGAEDVLEAAYADGRLSKVARRQRDDSVYLTANRGAWILFDLGRGATLVAAYLDVDLGSQLPDALVRSFTKRQLRSALQSLKALSVDDCDYDEQPIVHDGRGLPISRQSALEAAGRRPEDPRLARASAVAAASR